MQKFGFKCVLSTTLVCMALSSVASNKPKLTLAPMTDPSLQAPLGEMREVQYLVSNDGNRVLTFGMKTLQGITQQTDKAGFCKREAILQPGKTCVLSLLVDVSEAISAENKGPILCEVGTNLQDNDALCVQPKKTERISVQELPEKLAALSITITPPIEPSALKKPHPELKHCFAASCSIVLFQSTTATGSINIANNSGVSALNIQAYNIPTGVTVTSNTCLPALNSGSSCQITFLPGATRHILDQTVSVYGSNTQTYTINMRVLGVLDFYQGRRLYLLPSSTNNTFYTADASDTIPVTAPVAWGNANTACIAAGSVLPPYESSPFVSAGDLITALYNASNCAQPMNPNAILGFNCGGAVYYWSSANGLGFSGGMSFMPPGTLDPAIPEIDLNPARCVHRYLLS